MFPSTLALARSVIRWRWLAWGAGAGRRAARAQRRLAVLALVALAAAPFVLIQRITARGWDADALSAASAALVATTVVSVARSAARVLASNELFCDLGPRGAGVPSVLGAGAGLTVGLPFAAAVWVSAGWSPLLVAVPMAAVAAMLVRPRRAAGTPSVREAQVAAWADTPARVFTAGAFSAPRAVAALGSLLFGAAISRAAAGEGAQGGASFACASAIVLTGGLVADPARWLMPAWAFDGTEALAKAGVPVAVWLGLAATGAVGLAAAGGAPVMLAASLASGLGAGFVCWRLAYVGDDGAAWRDGAALAVAAAVVASIAPPALALVALGAAGRAGWRAVRRIAPGA